MNKIYNYMKRKVSTLIILLILSICAFSCRKPHDNGCYQGEIKETSAGDEIS